MEFQSFKNILNQNNILLFDAHNRIAHYRYNQYYKNNHNTINDVVFYKQSLLTNFINALLNNDKIRLNYINSLIKT